MPHDSPGDPVRWPADRAGDIIDVFCDAFRDYPVMRHVLGSAGARSRYAAYGDATHPFFAGRRHHHLNMIGVRRSHAGRGLARRLLESVHTLAEADPASEGVSLTTETPRNVPFYEHFGYRVVGHARVAGDLDTWGLFRERQV